MGAGDRHGPCPERAMAIPKRVRLRAAVVAFSGQKHVEPRSARPEAVEQERKFQEALRVSVERADKPEPHQPAECPSAHVQNLELMPGGESDAAHLRIAQRKKVEIGDVAVSE